TQHFFLDLPALGDGLTSWLHTRTNWRPNVLQYTLNMVKDLPPRTISRDIDWGIPVPLDGWSHREENKRYERSDAAIGYRPASIEWAYRIGEPEAWRQWWNNPQTRSYYFMGKDNITSHSQIWPAQLLGYRGAGDYGGEPGPFGELELPTEIVSSEFLTM